MKSFFTAILVTIFAAGATAVAESQGHFCYHIKNFSPIQPECSKCKEGYYFIAGPGPFCDIGFACCKGYCCLE
jgi:hypothetical protein